MGPTGYPETSYLSYNITPRVSSSLRMWPKDIPKRRIFPTIVSSVYFVRPKDGTERYPETSYLSYNITPCLFHQAWGCKQKISRNVVSFLQYYAVPVSSCLRMGPKRYPETSYLAYNITLRLNPKGYNYNFLLHGQIQISIKPRKLNLELQF